MNFTASMRQAAGVTIVDLNGRITAGRDANALRTLLIRVFQQGYRNLLLNLRGLRQIDSAGLGELVGVYVTIVQRGGMVKLLDPPAGVNDALHATRLDGILDIRTDEGAAVRSFSSGRAARMRTAVAEY